MAKKKEYTKLAGPGLMAYQRLYKGPDHFLVIEGVYQETYRRLFYRDIQALIYSPKKAGTITTWISALCFLICLLGIVTNSDSDLFAVWVVFATISGIVLLFSAIAGGTCSFAIKTPAQTLVLRGVSARRKARKLMRKVAEIVESVQGPLTQEALDESFSRSHVARSVASTSFPTPEGTPPVIG